MKLTHRGYTVVAWLSAFLFLTVVGFAGWLENLGL